MSSQGGWAGVKSLRKSGDYQKGDERILGDGEFVAQVLAQAEEQFQHKYRIKAEGYDLDRVIDRVAKITQLSPKEILDAERDRKRAQARSILYVPYLVPYFFEYSITLSLIFQYLP